MSGPAALLTALLLLLANAFFVGAEFALVSARRSQVEPIAAGGSRTARVTLHAMENVSLVMAGAQLGITACSLALGAIGEPAMAHLLEPVFDTMHLPENLFHPTAFALAMAIVVYLHVVVGEMVPKNLALAGPTRAALVLGPPMVFVVSLLRPFVVVLSALSNWCVRLLRIEPKGEVASAFTRDEVAAMVEESMQEGLLERAEYDRLAGAMGFTERSIERVLLPLDKMVTVSDDIVRRTIENLCATTGYSRFPVVSGPHIVGYVHVIDVLSLDEAEEARPLDRRWIRPLATLTPGTSLHQALAAMRRQGAHLGQVVAKDGTVLGFVALEDVLEELVGEIRDAAHDDEQ